MNRLELVRRLVYESGASGVTIGTTLNQSGDALNYVNWIDDAYLEIQGLHNWPSMWEQAALTLPASSSTLAQSLGHKRYVKDSGRIGGYDLDYMPWDEFRLVFKTISPGTPSVWTVRPDRSLAFNAAVSVDMQFTVERYRMPGRFTANADEPLLFQEHHMMIVWRGLMLYGGFDEAGVAYKRGASEYALLKRLAAGDLPAMEPGEPLL